VLRERARRAAFAGVRARHAAARKARRLQRMNAHLDWDGICHRLDDMLTGIEQRRRR
jgi:phage shock protein A